MSRDDIKDLISKFVESARKASQKLEIIPGQPVIDIFRNTDPKTGDYQVFFVVYRKDLMEWANIRANLVSKLLQKHNIDGRVNVRLAGPKESDSV